LSLRGSQTEINKVRVRLDFTDPISGSWPDLSGLRTAEGRLYEAGNVAVLLRSLTNGEATMDVHVNPELYISTNNYNTLFWDPLPPFVPTN
jgi:hypothetical protein